MLQLRFSGVLVKWRRLFAFLAAQQGKDGVEVLEQRLELSQTQVDFHFTYFYRKSKDLTSDKRRFNH